MTIPESETDYCIGLRAQLAAANARADHARDAALLEAAERFPDGRQPWPPKAIRKAILALRDKPAPAVTVQEAARVMLGTMKTDRAALAAIKEPKT